MSRPVALLFLLTLPLRSVAVELEAIEVTAEKDVDLFTTGKSTVVPTHQLEARPTALLSGTFDGVQGLVATQNGGPGGRVSFFLRGTESRHVSFTLDGLKLNDPSNTDRQFDAAFMTSAFIRNVRIHKGPQAVLFGSDAFGGMVELVSRKGETPGESRLSINGGSYGTVDASLSHDWKKDGNLGTVTVSRFHSDGISRLNKKRFRSREKDSADITQVTSSSSHRWRTKFQTDVLASYLRGENEYDSADKDNSEDRSRNDQYVLQQKTHYELSAASTLSLRNGMSRHQRFIQALVDSSEGSFGGNLFQHEALYRGSFGKHELLAGIATDHETYQARDLDKSFDLHSGFVQSAVFVEELKFQLGGRVDEHSRYGRFATGSTGVSHRSSLGTFSLQYSQGYKAPSLFQLYARPIFGFPIGNAGLVPEKNNSWELSWERTAGGFRSELTLFQNRLSNLITFSNLGYVNQGRFTSEGAELSGSYRSRRAELSASVTHLAFKDAQTVILRRPRNSGQVGLAWFHSETLESYGKLRFFDARRDLDLAGEPVKLNGYKTVEVGVRKTFEKDDVGIQVLNLFDKNYEELYGYSVLPRSVFVHYGRRF